MEKVGIKQLRSLKTEAFEKQPFLLCSDGKPVALIVPTGDLGEQEIATPKVRVEKPSQVKPQVKLPKVKMPILP